MIIPTGGEAEGRLTPSFFPLSYGNDEPREQTYVIGAVLATSPSFLHVRVVLNMVNDKRPLLHKHWFDTDRGPDTGVRVQMPLDHPPTPAARDSNDSINTARLTILSDFAVHYLHEYS